MWVIEHVQDCPLSLHCLLRKWPLGVDHTQFIDFINDSSTCSTAKEKRKRTQGTDTFANNLEILIYLSLIYFIVTVNPKCLIHVIILKYLKMN